MGSQRKSRVEEEEVYAISRVESDEWGVVW